MFTMQQTGHEAGDCTVPYSVEFDKVYTLQKFIEAIGTKKSEWGSINVYEETDVHNTVYMESYKHRKIPVPVPDVIANRIVRSAIASGGWSMMDYNIRLKEE